MLSVRFSLRTRAAAHRFRYSRPVPAARMHDVIAAADTPGLRVTLTGQAAFTKVIISAAESDMSTTVRACARGDSRCAPMCALASICSSHAARGVVCVCVTTRTAS